LNTRHFSKPDADLEDETAGQISSIFGNIRQRRATSGLVSIDSSRDFTLTLEGIEGLFH
jgi:hypothetical protein